MATYLQDASEFLSFFSPQSRYDLRQNGINTYSKVSHGRNMKNVKDRKKCYLR